MDHYPYNRKLLEARGLTSLPDRRMFDRRLSKADIKEDAMGRESVVCEGAS